MNKMLWDHRGAGGQLKVISLESQLGFTKGSVRVYQAKGISAVGMAEPLGTIVKFKVECRFSKLKVEQRYGSSAVNAGDFDLTALRGTSGGGRARKSCGLNLGPQQ